MLALGAPVVAVADTTIGLPDSVFLTIAPEVNMTDPLGAGLCAPAACVMWQPLLNSVPSAIITTPAAGVITS